jgi:hypothetical protein
LTEPGKYNLGKQIIFTNNSSWLLSVHHQKSQDPIWKTKQNYKLVEENSAHLISYFVTLCDTLKKLCEIKNERNLYKLHKNPETKTSFS